jgi:hypothetical protein
MYPEENSNTQAQTLSLKQDRHVCDKKNYLLSLSFKGTEALSWVTTKNLLSEKSDFSDKKIFLLRLRRSGKIS